MANVTVYLVRIINITSEMPITINCTYNANVPSYCILRRSIVQCHLVAFSVLYSHVCVCVFDQLYFIMAINDPCGLCARHIVHSYWKIFVCMQLCVLQIHYCMHSIRLIFKYIQHKVSILPVVTKVSSRHEYQTYQVFFTCSQ